MLIKSSQVNASDQLEQKILETERETETLTEELSRLDEMWNMSNKAEPDAGNEAAQDTAKAETPETEKPKDDKTAAVGKAAAKTGKRTPRPDQVLIRQRQTAKSKSASKASNETQAGQPAKSDDQPAEPQQQTCDGPRTAKSKSAETKKSETKPAEPVASGRGQAAGLVHRCHGRGRR